MVYTFAAVNYQTHLTMLKFILPIWLAVFGAGESEPQPTAPAFTGHCFTNSDGEEFEIWKDHLGPFLIVNDRKLYIR